MRKLQDLRLLRNCKTVKERIELDSATNRLINCDLVPTPIDRRTWTTWSFFSYWWSESWNVSTWSVGGAMIGMGGTIRDAILVAFFANLLAAVCIVLNGRAASQYSVGYPALARVTYGVTGHYFVLVIRAILGIIWCGVQLYFEAEFISICIRCIWPLWTSIPNKLPANETITPQVLICYFIAFFCTAPFMMIPTYKIRHIFTVKSIIMPFVGVGLVTWSLRLNHGADVTIIEDPALRESKKLFAWGVIAQFNAVMGATSALLVTVPDIARYSKTPRAQTYGQMLGLPLAHLLCTSFGIITAAAVKQAFGVVYWNPFDLLNAILERNFSAAARAGVFMSSLVFAFGTLGTSIACNIIPFAADITSLAPKYINIVRGQFICLLLAFSITPWRIVTTSNRFYIFLGGYCIFQGPIIGAMLADYYIVQRGNLDVGSMYDTSRESKYYYTRGCNMRAFGAFVLGCALPLPGLVLEMQQGQSSATGAISVWTQMYRLGWLLSFLMGGLLFLAIVAIFPPIRSDHPRWYQRGSQSPFESGVSQGQCTGARLASPGNSPSSPS